MNNQLQVVSQNKDFLEQFTPSQLELITTTVAKGATPDELKLFLYRCSLMKLNPLKPGQIHFIKYGTGPGTVVVGIEGFRSAAARTGKHVSTTRGVHRGDKGEIFAGWCKVMRRDGKGEIQTYEEETPMSEYFNDKNPSWRKMPETMIKKCAEAATLRMAYPDDLGGIYIQEERDLIEKVNEDHKAPWIEQPNADDGDQSAQIEKPYVFPFGSIKMMTPQEAFAKKGKDALINAMNLIDEKLIDGTTYKNVTMEEMKEAKDQIKKVIAHFENDTLEDSDNVEFQSAFERRD